VGATVDNWGALVRERVELGKTSKKRKREVQGNENQWFLPEGKSRKRRVLRILLKKGIKAVLYVAAATVSSENIAI
jgi:hypothetical protein